MIGIDFLLTSIIVVLIPGTGVIYTIGVGLGLGARAGIWAALGCTFGIVPHMLAAVSGLSALLHASAQSLLFIKYLGAAWLIYMGITIIRDKEHWQIRADQKLCTPWSITRNAVLINLLNPKSVLFSAAVLVAIFPKDMSMLDNAIVVANHAAIEMVCYSALAFFFSTPAVSESYLKAKLYLDRTA
ncbi:MAG: LysE family translocator, partial [Pseudomonadota bacterium]